MRIFLLNCFMAIIMVNLKDTMALSQEARDTVIYWHNRLRSDLMHGNAKNKTGMIPKPKNMMQMYYSLVLEKSAQDAADKCIYSHTDTNYGESFYSWPQELNETYVMEQSIIGWWTEAEARGVIGPYPNQTCFPYDYAQHSRQIGHWSQIAWWNTNEVGCAVGRCPRFKSNVYCHYWNRGNVYTGCVFWVGEPCIECPNNCNRTSLLCYNPKDPKYASSSTTGITMQTTKMTLTNDPITDNNDEDSYE
uniref:SCP domain-containing protein n=1 Tax=Meloidogyne graminicola TaxID=189291 RepID=A0A2R4SDG5_9BILA|nr:hypothetical protein [Meloidogyne graminicola]